MVPHLLPQDMGKGETLKNGVVGGLFAFVLHFVPFVGNLLAPVAGGWLAGHLQEEDAGGGLKAGVAAGAVQVIPMGLLAVGIFAFFGLAGAATGDAGGLLGGLLAGGLLGGVVFVGFAGYVLLLSAVGGLVGGAIVGDGE